VSLQVLPGGALPVSPTPTVNYEYDAEGNRTKQVQAPGVSGFNFTTQSAYDRLNRQKESLDAKSGLTQFGYDGRDQAVKVTDPRNLITQTPRNGLGDPTSLVSPDTGTSAFTYDAAGNVKTRTDARGVLATHAYDALNRLTQTVYSKTGQTSLTYTWTYDETGAGFANGIGRLTSTTHPTGSTQYTYDPQGRVLTDTQRVNPLAGANAAQVSKTVTYTYDIAGHVASILYPSGRKLTLTYSNGELSSMALAKDAATAPVNLVTKIKWEPFGGVKSWQWQMASGTKLHDRLYDAYGRTIRYHLGGSLRDLTYDSASRISRYTHYDASTAAAQPSLDQSFAYDPLSRLTGVTSSTASWSIGYDANGNRTNVTLNGTTSTYTTPASSNRLSTITNPSRSLVYDASGNTTSDTYTATYDLSGRMATLVKAGVTTTYSVDGSGRRVRKVGSTGATSTVVFVYDKDDRLLGEYDNTGTAIREFVWLGDTPVAVFMPDPANAVNPSLVYFIHTDHIDTPRVIVDKNNKVRWRWLSEPFGTTAPENNPSGLGQFVFNLRFPGQYFDQESGLHYNYHRTYDPGLGAYTTPDPLGLGGGQASLYPYVNNDPLESTDPEGLVPRPRFRPGIGPVPVPVDPPLPAPGASDDPGSSGRREERDWGREFGRGRYECVIRFTSVEIAGAGQGKGNSGCCPDFIHGWGFGSSPDEAWNNAFQAGNMNTPPGCQKRHPRGIYGSCKNRVGGKAK
jgi:RHS repeat-associated protein